MPSLFAAMFSTATLLLTGCATLTVPAAVRLADGRVLTGTTTASVSAGTFEVTDPAGALSCGGNYDQFDTAETISAPVACSDGRTGVVTLKRTADRMAGTGNVFLSDGTRATAGFGRLAATVANPPVALNTPPPFPPSPTGDTASLASLPADPPASATSSYEPSRSPTSYSGNCPTPDSLDAAGHRCGRRSAASRPGGYDGYGGYSSPRYSSGGSVHVGGYFRKNGTYVRSYTRRR